MLRYPFCGVHRTSKSRALQKRGRGYRTQVAMLRHQKPHSVVTPLACYRIGVGPPARNRKNEGNGLPQEIGKE